MPARKSYSTLAKDTGDHQAHSSAFSGNGWQSELVSMSPLSLHVLFSQTHHKASIITVFVLACLVAGQKCHALIIASASLTTGTWCIPISEVILVLQVKTDNSHIHAMAHNVEL